MNFPSAGYAGTFSRECPARLTLRIRSQWAWMNVDLLIRRLGKIAGDEHVVTHPDQLRTYESDGLLQCECRHARSCCRARPERCRRSCGRCFEAEVPWVARGAGTGLSGGALPVEDGVVIALSRLRRIIEVDLENQRIVVEPGVTNLEVSRAVAPTHFYPPDPSSQVVCTIGGNVAENSGGAHCFKYGFTTNYVTGLEVVLPDGSSSSWAARSSTSPATTSSAPSSDPRARWASRRG